MKSHLPSIWIKIIGISLLLLWAGSGQYLSALSVQYAEGFSIEERRGYTLLHIHLPVSGREVSSTYVVVPRDSEKSISEKQIRETLSLDSTGPKVQFIKTPVKKLIPLSTTFLPPLELLDVEHVVSGIDKLDLIYSEKLRTTVVEQNIPQVGNGPSLDVEKVVHLKPVVVMANYTQGEWNVIPKLKKASIPVILNGDYLESDPLGRAEWMKFIGLLCGRAAEAEKQFNDIAEDYTYLKEKVASALSRDAVSPKVVMNRPMNGRWVVPGGKGYMAQFIKDAGGEYLWAQDSHSRSLVLDVEEVFLKALRADFWLHQYGRTSLEDLAGEDQRLGKLKAFQEGNVVNNDARMNEAGSNDFYESGPYRPDVILADLISLFHPSLLPAHSLYYYRYLQ